MEDDGQVKVRYTPGQLNDGGKRTKILGKRENGNDETIVVVGGGGAAHVRYYENKCLLRYIIICNYQYRLVLKLFEEMVFSKAD